MVETPERRQRREVLIVEDNRSQSLTLSALLQREGFGVVVAQSAAEAIEQLEGGEFDVAIVDLRLPDGDGTQLFATFQAKAPKTRIIIYTAFGSYESAKKAVNAGVFAYVEKAAHPAELVNQVHRAIQDHLSEALKASEQRYRTLMESANDAIFIADAETGMVLNANRKAQELIGRSLPEIRQMNYTDLHPAEERGRYTELFKRHLTNRRGFTGDLHVVGRDGHLVPVEISASLIEVDDRQLLQGIFRDLTERKRSEQEIEQSRTLYRSLVESLPQSIIRKDLEGRITFANERFCRLLNKPLDDIIGKNDFDFYPPELVEKHRHDERRVIETREILQTVEEHVPADGNKTYLDVIKTPVYDALNRVIGIQVIFWDITARLLVEQELQTSKRHLQEALDELKQTQQQVIRQERLRALGEMANGIAHDFNSSLSPVLGYAELAASTPDLPDDVRKWLDCIQTGARDAAAVVERLREFYRPETAGASVAAVNLHDVLRQIPELTRPKWQDEAQRAGRSIEFASQVEDEMIVLGSASELRELFTNLVFNAVDAMPSGGQITLSARATAGFASVEVADTGVGMTEQVASRCFEPFFTTTKTEGTGLGLSVCHGIIQRHGGRIEIDTEPGRGTTFHILLPLAERAASAVPEEMSSSLPSHRVLYIDDDPRLRELVFTLLGQLGQQVDLADDGATGLEMVQANDYDVVLTDLGMPEIDGCDVTRTVRSVCPGIPVIMVTGWGAQFSRRRLDDAVEPDQLVAKPLTLTKLRQALQKVFA